MAGHDGGCRGPSPLAFLCGGWCWGRRKDENGTVGPELEVSTVFLGVDHRFGDGPPIVFESMVFQNTAFEVECRRYSTAKEARAGHAELVDKYSRGIPKNSSETG